MAMASLYLTCDAIPAQHGLEIRVIHRRCRLTPLCLPLQGVQAMSALMSQSELFKITKIDNDRRTVEPAAREVRMELINNETFITWSPNSLMFAVKDSQAGCLIIGRDGNVLSHIAAGALAVEAEWSPNSERLLLEHEWSFRGHERGFETVLEVYTIDNGNPIARETFGGGVLSARWAPDSVRIAVLVAPSNGPVQLLLWNVRDRRVIVANTADAKNSGRVNLHWSPDGESVAAAYEQSIDIYDAHLDGGKVSIDVPARLARWYGNSSMLMAAGTRTGNHDTVCTLDRNGDILRKIPFRGMMHATSLSSNNLFLCGEGYDQEIYVAYMGKWSPRTNHLFSRDLRSIIFRMLVVRQSLDMNNSVERERGVAPLPRLPRLPLEVWFLIFEMIP